ncbi:cytochrome c biogenesis protein ResB [Streptomyces sp. DSM 44917]|uniref:Cytochrome c biogenesis protein ResB n=1 Tax=Streptomyces boetiae TaxID=3075541 RepID=A0ABU2LDG0_9ACTN|nr:cytochrome c biogenesis protein ResB [Streptomyces sp. DSM 44917]MDT0309624.1 cytochrome c biogenesis protein ResB [Streptomyces sp. DSM 44917]
MTTDETATAAPAASGATATAAPDGTVGRDEAEAALGLSTAPLEDPPPAPAPAAGEGTFGGVRAPGARGAAAWLLRELTGWARWFWRQLTSMRIALLLLFLLALASIPGSMIPQDDVDATLAQDFRVRNPGLSEFYERLQLFDVYSSVWFSAIYLLLFVSLIGCIVPRSWQFVGQLRGRPPRAPRRLDRMPAYTTWRTEAPPERVLQAARAVLRRRRFRAEAAADHVAAEKGYLREAGNLVFHLALIVLLIAFAAGRLSYAEGGKLIVQGEGFSNTLTQYDDFESGRLFDVDGLEPFGFTLEEFEAEFVREGPDLGTPTDFRADVTYWTPDGPERETTITVNDPLTVGDARVRLLGHGYAPVVTVTDGQGRTAFHGPVPFLPQDAALTSTGVIKVSDYRDAEGARDQLGFQGIFSPTYALDAVRGPHSTFPEPDSPVLTLTAFRGDLGVNSGIPQNVYQLQTRNMEQLTDESGEPLRFNLHPGQSYELPDGLGTISMDSELEEWATFQVTTKAGNDWALAGAFAAVAGLAGSLLLQRRRVWVRAASAGDGTTVVEMAALGRTESGKVPEELARLAARLQPEAPPAAAPPGEGPDDGPGDGPGTPPDPVPSPHAAESAPAESAAAEGAARP